MGAPLLVTVGIEIDQVASLDQVAENFTVVGALRLSWSDPLFAFDAGEFGRDYRVLAADDFVREAEERATVAPSFVFQNQQGQRWVQESLVVIHDEGHIEYLERFTATFQAPVISIVKRNTEGG